MLRVTSNFLREKNKHKKRCLAFFVSPPPPFLSIGLVMLISLEDPFNPLHLLVKEDDNLVSWLVH